MRVWWAILALACSQPAPEGPSTTPPTVIDASVPLQVSVGVVGDGPFYVVRGESVDIPFVVGGSDATHAVSVGALGLPSGVSAAPVMLDGATAGNVTIHASSDAILGDANCAVITQKGGTSVFRLAVIDIDGSLDPGFAEKGILALPTNVTNIVGIGAAQGSIVIAGTLQGTTKDAVYVERHHEDGSLDATYGDAGRAQLTDLTTSNGITAAGGAVCADGSAALAAVDTRWQPDAGSTNEERLLVFDTSGSLTTNLVLSTQPKGPFAVACSGGSIFVADGDHLFAFDATQALHTTQVPNPDAYVKLAATPTAIFVGFSRIMSLVPNTSGDWVVASTFGNDGGVVPSGTPNALVADGPRLLAATTSNNGPEILLDRFLADGAVDTTFGNAGVASTGLSSGAIAVGASVVEPTSGDAYVAVTNASPGHTAIARLDTMGQIRTTFGDGGSVVTDFSSAVSASPAGMAFDSLGRLWLAVNKSTTSSALARYRIVAP